MQAALTAAGHFSALAVQGLTIWATRCPSCPTCPGLTCACPAISCALTCSGPASTGEIRSETVGSAETSLWVITFIFVIGGICGSVVALWIQSRVPSSHREQQQASEPTQPESAVTVASAAASPAPAKAFSAAGASPLRLKNQAS